MKKQAHLLGFLVLFLSFAVNAFAGNKNDLAYLGYDELGTVNSLAVSDELVVFESDVPKRGTSISSILALATTFSTLGLTGNLTIDGRIDIGTVETFTDEDATPDVSTGSYFNTNTTATTITDFDGTGISDGQVIVVVSKGDITYDVTSSGIKGGSTDIITAAGDVTTFLYDGTDWLVIARMDMSDDLN